MSTLNISLPASLKDFIEDQVAKRGYGTSSEYIRELVRRDRARQQLRSLLKNGSADSGEDEASDGARARMLHRRAHGDEE